MRGLYPGDPQFYGGDINGRRTRYAEITAEVLRTKMMPEYTISTRLPGIIDVVDVQAPNGETVTVGVDANGEVVGAETKPANWVPLALAAGAAYFFLA